MGITNLKQISFYLDDRKFRIPRKWSNRELKKFASLFEGKIINVSGWKDLDKEGNRYKDYFINATEYWISNYKSEARGFQGNLENEIFLDLTKDIPSNLYERFNVVFNHTTLEHIFDIFITFENLCKLSKDIIIITVPFLQEQHANYGDYWRFTPLAIKHLFKKNGVDLIYINFNDWSKTSIYIFAIGSKHPNKWKNIISHPDNKIKIIDNYFLGRKIIKNPLIFYFKEIFKRIFKYT